MHQPFNNPYSPEVSSQSSSSPSSQISYSNKNSPVPCHSPASTHLGNSLHPYTIVGGRDLPCLSILNQPQAKFRFRYASEMTGTHGCLMAESKDRNKKECIRVQLEGCQVAEAIIQCTLVTNSPKPVPHVHRLGGEGHSNLNEGDYQEIVVSSSKNDWIATFSGLTIIHTAKKQVREVVLQRLIREKGNTPLNRSQEQQLKDEADNIANTMDLHSVKLKFEAFVERNGFRERLTPPVYSQAIHNLKSTHAGDLRIVRIDKVYSCCTGQEEIFIFVEKVNKKDIKIRFFETDENDQETWSAFADFSELDVHHQYAIAFKTPAYQDVNIQSDVTVYFQLFRPSNQSTSEAKSFTYTPRERVGAKRPRPRETPVGTDSNVNKRDFISTRTIPIQGQDNSVSRNPLGFPGASDGKGAQNGCLDNLTPGNHFNHEIPVVSGINQSSNGYPGLIDPLLQASFTCPQFISSQTFTSPYQDFSSSNLMEGTNHMETVFSGSENLSWPEINLQEIDDILLTELLRLEDSASDAAAATDSNDLTLRLKNLKLSKLKTSRKTISSSTSKKQLPLLGTPGLLSTYSFNMAQALRWYAITGDFAHILGRMLHLMALQSDDGNNALHEALLHDRTEVVRGILHAVSYQASKVDFVNAQNHANIAPLHISVERNMTESTALLLQNGANPNVIDGNGNTPLHLAAVSPDQMGCLKLLFDAHVKGDSPALKLNLKNYAGLTPLHIAVRSKNMECMQILLAKGADVNCPEAKSGKSSLHLAVQTGSVEVVTSLLRWPSTNVDIQTYDGSSALHLAVTDNLYDICALLIQHGANPNLTNYIDNVILSDSEECDDTSVESHTDDSAVRKGQSPLDLSQNNSAINRLLSSSVKCSLMNSSKTEKDHIGGKKSFGVSSLEISDSGIDISSGTSKDLSKELDKRIIKQLAKIFDSPNKDWEKLADSLGVLTSMRSILDGQSSPTTYLLSNIDLWEISPEILIEKLHALQFGDAAHLLKKYLES